MKILKYIALMIGAFALFVFGTNKVIEVNRAAKINERFAADSEAAVFSATSKAFTEETYSRGRRRSAGTVYRADLTYTTADGRTVNVSGVPISTGERDLLNLSNKIQCLYLKSDTQQVLCKGGAEMNESSSYPMPSWPISLQSCCCMGLMRNTSGITAKMKTMTMMSNLPDG